MVSYESTASDSSYESILFCDSFAGNETRIPERFV